jgi:hypothetical protein
MKDANSCWLCEGTNNKIMRLMVYVLSHQAKSVSDVDSWSLVDGITFAFCPVCGETVAGIEGR